MVIGLLGKPETPPEEWNPSDSKSTSSPAHHTFSFLNLLRIQRAFLASGMSMPDKPHSRDWKKTFFRCPTFNSCCWNMVVVIRWLLLVINCSNLYCWENNDNNLHSDQVEYVFWLWSKVHLLKSIIGIACDNCCCSKINYIYIYIYSWERKEEMKI